MEWVSHWGNQSGLQSPETALPSTWELKTITPRGSHVDRGFSLEHDLCASQGHCSNAQSLLLQMVLGAQSPTSSATTATRYQRGSRCHRASCMVFPTPPFSHQQPCCNCCCPRHQHHPVVLLLSCSGDGQRDLRDRPKHQHCVVPMSLQKHPLSVCRIKRMGHWCHWAVVWAWKRLGFP